MTPAPPPLPPPSFSGPDAPRLPEAILAAAYGLLNAVPLLLFPALADRGIYGSFAGRQRYFNKTLIRQRIIIQVGSLGRLGSLFDRLISAIDQVENFDGPKYQQHPK